MANLSNAELYARIQTFKIDDPDVELPFVKRLARENNWTISYSQRAIEEYKNFIYLCMATGHACTPSDEVDQVWHLHMLYTSSYFERLCKQILRKTIAHEPTRGGSQEGEKFHDWYAKTLESYEKEFGKKPPMDIWPAPKIRFGEAPHFQRINTKDHFVLSKRKVKKWAFTSAALCTVVFAIGCSSQTNPNSSANDQLIWIGVFIVLLIIWQIWANRKNRGGSGCSSGCGSTGSCGSSGHDSSGCSSSGCSSGCGGGCGGGGD